MTNGLLIQGEKDKLIQYYRDQRREQVRLTVNPQRNRVGQWYGSAVQSYPPKFYWHSIEGVYR